MKHKLACYRSIIDRIILNLIRFVLKHWTTLKTNLYLELTKTASVRPIFRQYDLEVCWRMTSFPLHNITWWWMYWIWEGMEGNEAFLKWSNSESGNDPNKSQRKVKDKSLKNAQRIVSELVAWMSKKLI
jgi:hypothetical protein